MIILNIQYDRYISVKNTVLRSLDDNIKVYSNKKEKTTKNNTIIILIYYYTQTNMI